MPLFPELNRMPTTVVAVLELSLLGNSLLVDEDYLLTGGGLSAMSEGQMFNTGFFVVLYITFTVMSIIVLLKCVVMALTAHCSPLSRPRFVVNSLLTARPLAPFLSLPLPVPSHVTRSSPHTVAPLARSAACSSPCSRTHSTPCVRSRCSRRASSSRAT